MRHQRFPHLDLRTQSQGYSLVELLVSIVIIIILMAMLFQFMAANQKTYMSQQLQSEVSQGPRSAFEIMGQELNQAGFNPPFGKSRTLVCSPSPCPASGSAIVDLTLSLPLLSGMTPTHGIFYGTRLVIGNTCKTSGTPPVTTCDQEEVPVTFKNTYPLSSGATRAITAKTVPVVLTNNHDDGETVYSRNYPFPTGVYYDHHTASVYDATYNTLMPDGIADNVIKFYGDILGTGDLYYGEYRLQKYDPATRTYFPACTGTSSTGVDTDTAGTTGFVLTRYLAKLANKSTGVFEIPADKASAVDPRGNALNVAPLASDPNGQAYTVSPLVDHIIGTCAASSWTYTAPDATSPSGSTAVSPATHYGPTGTATPVVPLLNPDGTPAIWLKMYTFGSYDATTGKNNFQSFVVDVAIALTVQRSQSVAQGGAVSTQRLQTHIAPRNIWDALQIAESGGASLLPQTPTDPTFSPVHNLPLN